MAGRFGFWARVALLGAVAVPVGATVYLARPGATPWLPRCLFHDLTGLHCPGCGNTRALHALLHGDVAASLSHNLLLIPGLLLVALLLLFPRWAGNRWLCLTVAAVILAFFLLRHLAFPPFSLLAP